MYNCTHECVCVINVIITSLSMYVRTFESIEEDVSDE